MYFVSSGGSISGMTWSSTISIASARVGSTRTVFGVE